MGISLDRYEEAERSLAKVEAKRGVVVHAVITAIVSVVLISVNVFLASEFPWSVFAVVGMGAGLGFHYVFGLLRVEENVESHQHRVELLARSAR
jgi:hypothetical protein